EAVEQACAARRLELVLAAAARAVRRIPRLHVPGVLQTGAIVMADDRGALAALGPVAAGGVATGGREPAVRIGAGQDVMLVGRVAASLDRVALLAQGRLLVDVDLVGVQLVDVGGDDLTLGILPGAL